MSEPTKAVFLSYASQDAEAAKRICDALRAAGVEVWFDQSELRGGDAWDAMIRKRIKECALFVPVITPATNARAEGYFRLEWKLAVDRSHLMADDAPFLFPIVLGDVQDATARVPDKFRDVQWTRLRLDETPAELGARVAKLLLGGAQSEDRGQRSEDRSGRTKREQQPTWLRYAWMGVGLLFAVIFAVKPLWQSSRRSEPKPAVAAPAVPVAPAGKPAAPAVSEARQLAERARTLFDKLDSNADDFAVAESLLKRALELDATDGVIWAYSARLNAAYLTRSFERGTARAETARNHAERAVKLAPESAEAWHALGRAIWRSDPPRAEEALRHALQLAPDDGRILLSLGSIYRNTGRDEEALAFYVRAATRPEVRPLALYDQFLIHLYLRRFEEADRCGREASALLPTTNSVSGLAMLEIVWRGRVDAAQRTLDAAPAALRSEPRMVFASALAAVMLKQSDEALRALDRLPGDFISDAWYSGPKALLVGLAHAQAGRAEAARTAWEGGLAVVRRRLQDTPNDAELHLRLGELLAWTGQAEPALREARVFEELARGRNDWTYSSARIYAALGRADEAVPILEKFLTATATGRWPLTPALLRLDPLWDKLRGDPRFQKLLVEHAPPRDWPKDPELKKAFDIFNGLDSTVESYRLAEEMVGAVLKQRPTDPEATTVYAILNNYYLNRGYDSTEDRVVLARRFNERALQLSPEDPEAMAAMAQFLTFRRSDLPRAEQLIRQAIALVPDEPRFSRILVYNVLYGTRNLDAVTEAKAACVRFPRDPLTQYNLALICRATGDLELMEQSLDRTLALAPVGSAMIWKGWLAAWLHGDLPGFKAWLDKISGNFRLNERAIYMRYVYASLSGDAGYGLEAVGSHSGAWMNDFYYTGPRSLLLADLLAQQGRKDLAREEYERALAEIRRHMAANPNEARNLAEFWVMLGLGRMDEARAGARKFYEQQARPYWPLYMIWWQSPIPAQLLTGNRPEALALMKEAVTLPVIREQIRVALKIDPRMAPFRNDPEIKALLAEPEANK